LRAVAKLYFKYYSELYACWLNDQYHSNHFRHHHVLLTVRACWK